MRVRKIRRGKCDENGTGVIAKAEERGRRERVLRNVGKVDETDGMIIN